MGKVIFDKMDLLLFIIIGIGFIGLILALFLHFVPMSVYCGLLIALAVGILLGKDVFSLPGKISMPKDRGDIEIKEIENSMVE